MVSSVASPIKLYCDHDGAIIQAKEPKSHQKSKHMLKMFYLLQQIVGRRNVKECKLPTKDNVAYLLTNYSLKKKYEKHFLEMTVKLIIE